MSSRVLVINDPQFGSEVLQAQGLVLVYFWAPWCGPCRLMSPMIEGVAEQFGDRLKIVKMEVDPNPESVARYKVEGVPALILFKEGELLDSVEGVINKQKLQDFLSTYLP